MHIVESKLIDYVRNAQKLGFQYLLLTQLKNYTYKTPILEILSHIYVYVQFSSWFKYGNMEAPIEMLKIQLTVIITFFNSNAQQLRRKIIVM